MLAEIDRYSTIVLISLIVIFAAALFNHPLPAKDLTIAVVRDGLPADDEFVRAVESELKLLLPAGVDVEFKSAAQFDAGWDPASTRQVLQNALNDPEINYILATGALVTEEAAKPDLILNKPVVSSFAQNSKMLVMPYGEEDHSLKENFTFLFLPELFVEDARVFQTIIPSDTLYLAIGKEFIEQIPYYRTEVREHETRLGVKIEFIPITTNLDESLSQVSKRIKAVYLERTPRLILSQRAMLIEQLLARKIPVFSLISHADVEMGALAARTPDIFRQVVRRSALNFSALYRGVPAEQLPVRMSVESKLLINGQTAAAIGYRPDLLTRSRATILYEEKLETEASSLTFAQALKMAEQTNVLLRIKDAEVETIKGDMRVFRSSLLPQINANASYINRKIAGLEDVLPKNIGNAGVNASQMIYDDQIVSNFRTAKRRYEGSEFDREAQRLDVLAGAGESFLLYVLSRVFYRIESDNYKLTEDNLELSKIRLEAGYSGKDEVFRWEAELAKRRTNLFDSQFEVEQRRVALNQFLGIDQKLQWVPEEIRVDENKFIFLEGRIQSIFRSAEQFEKFREFMIAFSIENAPELQFLRKAIEAQEIQLNQRKRSYFLPKFFIDAGYDYNFYRSPDNPEIDKDSYQLGITASLPLFEGSRRIYDVQRNKALVKGLENERQLRQDLVERRSRTAVRAFEASFPSIKFALVAAENAKKNLDVVQDKYSQGIVNVTDLLEAQNESFIANQNAVAVVYNFLLDMVEFQRSISWFEAEKSAREKEDLAQKIQAAIAAPQ